MAGKLQNMPAGQDADDGVRVVPIAELVNDIISSPVAPIDNIQEAYHAYNYNDIDIPQTDTINDVIRAIDNADYLGESSFTRILTQEALRPLSAWAKDERSIRLHAPKNEAGEALISDAQLQNLEEQMRERVEDDDLTYYFSQLLVTGLAVVSCGLGDYFFVPQTTDATYDYENKRYVFIKRVLSPAVIQYVMDNWTQASEDMADDIDDDMPAEATAKPDEDNEAPKVNADSTEEIETIHGQIKNAEGQYIEFVRHEDEIYYTIHDKPVIFTHSFTIDPETRMPQGIFGVCSREEIRAIDLFRAINSRTVEAIRASLIVASGTMSAAQHEGLYAGGSIVVNNKKFATAENPVKPFEFVPSRAHEIAGYVEELTRLEMKIRTATGLYKRQTEVTSSNTSATEILEVYKNTTETYREIITKFSYIFAECIEIISNREAGHPIRAEVISNPLDERLQIEGVDSMLELCINAITSDPTGQKFGGLFNPQVAEKLVKAKAQGFKLDLDIFPTPMQTAASTQQGMEQAQQEERDAAQRLADAEILKGKAEVSKAKNAEAKLQFDIQKHQDDMLVEMAKMRIEAKKVEDDSSHKMLGLLIEARTKQAGGKPNA